MGQLLSSLCMKRPGARGPGPLAFCQFSQWAEVLQGWSFLFFVVSDFMSLTVTQCVLTYPQSKGNIRDTVGLEQ